MSSVSREILLQTVRRTGTALLRAGGYLMRRAGRLLARAVLAVPGLRTLVGRGQALIDWARRYEFRDCRLMVEQNGTVHYWVITAELQRRAVRGSLFAGGGVAVVVLGMVAVSMALSVNMSRLERSHEEIYRALLETYDGNGGIPGKPDQEQLLAIANSIRVRNQEVERFVDRSLATISGENAQLAAALNDSGLTGQAVRVIQLSTPVGGYSQDSPPKSNLGQVGDLADAMAKNRSLRDVLNALPDHLPISSPRLSSSFGLRVHPLTGKPQFHTGIDLVPGDDLQVHASMRGKVVFTGYNEVLGNMVVVRHGSGVETVYGHMASIAAHNGDDVNESSILGIVGNTGTGTTGRHLHFEVSVGGYPVNPLKVIQTAQNVRKIEAQD